jgi:hypothetical protein
MRPPVGHLGSAHEMLFQHTHSGITDLLILKPGKAMAPGVTISFWGVWLIDIGRSSIWENSGIEREMDERSVCTHEGMAWVWS